MAHSCWTSPGEAHVHAGRVEVHGRYFEDLLLRVLAQKTRGEKNSVAGGCRADQGAKHLLIRRFRAIYCKINQM